MVSRMRSLLVATLVAKRILLSALMALLFVGGVMNIWWIIGITLYVAVEKLVPGGNRLARPMGATLVLAGLSLLLQNFDAG